MAEPERGRSDEATDPAPGRWPIQRAFLVLAALALLTPAPSRAALGEQCAWPPPGGPAIHPESDLVEMAPMVADLDGDGAAEIVVITFRDADDDSPGHDGMLRIIRGSDCSEIVAVPDVGCVTCFGDAACGSLNEVADPGFLCPGCGVAIADLDGDGMLEIVALSEGDGSDYGNQRIVVFNHDGSFRNCGERTPEREGSSVAPLIADLDADGTPEIVVRTTAWEPDGRIAWAAPATGLGLSTAADVDGDGKLEVLTGEAEYSFDGTLRWFREDLLLSSPAVADLDLDCVPEVIASARNAQQVHVLDAMTGATRAVAPIPPGDCPPRRDGQGGPPTLADTDGDCVPEIGIAGCRRYALYKYVEGPPEQLVELWESPTDDASSRITGSSIFDLDGDGTAEVLYNDQTTFHVYDAVTGTLEQQLENSTFTLVEYPVVADVNGDGHAEVLLAANDYAVGSNHGLRVIHDDATPWVSAPALFNEHAFHVTNVNPDGTIPVREEPSWARYNSFRVQGPPIRSTEAPILLGVPGDVTVSCDSIPAAPAVSATGGCGESPAVAFDEQPASGPCGQVVRTWSATDRCGRTTDVTQVISVVDDVAPSIAGVPADVTLPCGSPLPPASPSAADACDPAPALTTATSEQPGPCPRVVTRTWTATDACGNAITATQHVTFVDGVAPVIAGVPADVTLPCGSPLPPASPSATDACDPAPALTMTTSEQPGPCPRVVTRTWTATDACGNAITATQHVTFVDDVAPVIAGVPADVTLPCGSPLPPARPSATDACDPAPALTMTTSEQPGPCPRVVTRTWTATDACGNAITATQHVTFVDDVAPVIAGVPADVVATCHAVPPPASPSAADACTTATLAFDERRIDGPCADTYRLVRTWTATDACGNRAVATQNVEVGDGGPPLITGPADVVVECPLVPPAGSVSVTDDCDPAPVVAFAETRIDGACPNDYVLLRTWTATDRCGRSATHQQRVQVVDTTPPTISGSESRCLWSPNHWMACFGPDALHPSVTDACGGAVTWRFAGCASDQPENALGDGDFAPDCVVDDAGNLCVRSERQGMLPPGRHYGVLAIAVDACGNASAPSLIADLWVPRDQREHPDCLKIQDVGDKGHGRPSPKP